MTDEHGKAAVPAFIPADYARAVWGQFRPTLRHVKTGGLYMPLPFPVVIGATGEVGLVYRSELDVLWVRPRAEFNDGRFEWLEVAETDPPLLKEGA